MLNKIKVVEFDLWDSDTGEADIVAEFANGKKLRAFTIDEFEQGEELDVVVSLFCKEYSLSNKLEIQIENINDKYETSIQGKVVQHVSNEEEGEYIFVDCNGIYVRVFNDFEEDFSNLDDLYFKGNGRLDIEIQGEEW